MRDIIGFLVLLIVVMVFTSMIFDELECDKKGGVIVYEGGALKRMQFCDRPIEHFYAYVLLKIANS